MPRSATSPARPERKRRVGSTTPRVFTPPLVTGEPGPCGCGCALTPDTSLGFAIVDFATDVLLIALHPWQRWLLIHMMELLPDNSLRFRTVVVLVARQNGKSLVSRVVALWFLYVYGVALVLGTAQDLDTAEDVWQGAVDLVEELDEDDEPLRPDLYDLLHDVVKVNGKKALVIDRPPGMTGKPTRRYKVKAANRRAGRGLSGDLIMLDELREHQSWDAWGAITKTTMARAFALVLCLSNAGDATSVVLRYLRLKGHASAGDPDGLNADATADALKPDTDPDPDAEDDEDEWDDEELVDDLFLAEWSAPPGCSVKDRDGWAQANPSMNHPNGISERTIASACGTDPEHVFRPEVLCQWLDSSSVSFFPIGTWEAGRFVDGVHDMDDWQIVTNVKACISTSHDRTTTYVAFAGRRADGLPQVEVVARRAGEGWVRDWLMDAKRHDLIEEVTGQSKGAPVSDLMKALKVAYGDREDDFDIPVIDWGGDDLAGWTGAVYDLVAQGALTDDGDAVGLRHMPHPDLDVAAATAVAKPLAERFVVDLRNSPADAAPLVAAIGALGLLLRAKATPTRSAYEDRVTTPQNGDNDTTEARPVVMTV